MAKLPWLGTCILTAALMQGCASLPFFGKDKEEDDGLVEEDAKQKPASHDEDDDVIASTKGRGKGKAKQSATEEQELKLAKLWARVDEMEEEQYRMKEKVRLLEKGLTLGLVPEELKKGSGKGKPAKAPAHAEKADRNKPIHLEADRVTVDDAKQIATFTGNVVLTQGTMVMRGDRMEVRQDKDGFRNGTVWGNLAYFRQKRDGTDDFIEGWSERIEYDSRADKVQMFTRAMLKRGRAEAKAAAKPAR